MDAEFAACVAEALGAEAALNPALAEVGLCAWGWSGPWAGRRGSDSLVQTACGLAAEGAARMESDRPRPLPVQALDQATGWLMAAAALRALRIRRASGRVLSARLSLARTAALLLSGGIGPFAPPLAPETEADLAPEVEETGWGPARRVAFPVELDGQGPLWREPAGPLRAHPPRWAPA